jgi:flagellar motility protein MotE (MotC chaperone)
MNTTDNFPGEDLETTVAASATELQRQLHESLKQLSPERLQVLSDFAAYLANAESEAATQELLAIPGLLERIKQNQTTPKANYTSWSGLRTDVSGSAPS